MRKAIRRFCCLGLCAIGLALGSSAYAAGALSAPPDHPNSSARYVFYLHGQAVEDQGPQAKHPQTRQSYDLDGIYKAFAAKGFTVIGETRPANSDPAAYAAKTAQYVRSLLDAGVPGRNISILGHAKGGLIALMTAAEIGRNDIAVAVLGACPPKAMAAGAYGDFATGRAAKLKGRVMVLYDSGDREAGGCKEILARAPKLTANELVLETGMGGGLFYTPHPLWVALVESWITPAR